MGRLELNKKKKKADLYNTAYELFTTKGVAQTTISDIAERAGVAKGTFYLYFKNKYEIHDRLVVHKTGELFFKAQEALKTTSLTAFNDRLFFIIDYILDTLEHDTALLLFISKNLSWGVFRGAFEQEFVEEDYHFYRSYLKLLSESSRAYLNPEVMLFTIIELVSSTCYSCILYKQPISIKEYKPYLYRAINGILDSFSQQM